MRVSSWCWVGAACAVALFASPVEAQRQRGGGGGVCDPRTSEHVELKTIAADPDRWLGHCVTVPGIYSAERVYADLDAVYGVTSNSIGGYVDGHGSMDGFWDGEFTGRIADCAAAAANIDAGLLKSPGILIDNSRQAGCREPKGQFLLFMSQGDLQPTKLRRRTSPKDPGASLGPPPEDWPHAGPILSLVAQFRDALQKSDRKTLSALLGGDYAADMMLASDDNAITSLKTGEFKLIERVPKTQPAPDSISSVVCACRGKDCSKLWPIALRDADNQPSRPYACLRVYGVKDDKGAWSYSLDASRTFDGLPEPAR